MSFRITLSAKIQW